MKTFPITASGGVKSISDDDLCSDCAKCHYNPGDMSRCDFDWPGLENADGYVVECHAFVRFP
jgi:hypothetical protein